MITIELTDSQIAQVLDDQMSDTPSTPLAPPLMHQIETHDDVQKFGNVFSGWHFGQRGKTHTIFGERGQLTTNPYKLCIQLRTPANDVTEVAFYAGDSMSMGGDRVVVVSKKPWAKWDDEGVIGYKKYLQGHPNTRLSMFINSTGIDPHPPWRRDNTQKAPYKVPRTAHLMPDTVYYAHLYRLVVHSNHKHNPMFLEYSGT